ncbi:hypothetical protein ACOME3_010452 [Neoechinorhynchus agilis]
MSHYYNPRPVRVFAKARQRILAERWDFVPIHTGDIPRDILSKIENYLKVWNLSASVRQLYSFLLPYYRLKQFEYSDVWLLDSSGAPSALNNLCWHIECPICNMVSIKHERRDIVIELGRDYYEAKVEIASWENIIAAKKLSEREFFSSLRPLTAEIEAEGMPRTAWVEREADCSIRYIPPPTKVSEKVASLFPGSAAWQRSCALVSRLGLDSLLEHIYRSLNLIPTFEGSLLWMRRVSAFAKANITSTRYATMLVDLNRWLGHFPLLSEGEMIQSAREWLGRMNSCLGSGGALIWERLNLLHASELISKIFSSIPKQTGADIWREMLISRTWSTPGASNAGNYSARRNQLGDEESDGDESRVLR